uniref:Oxygen-dependent protoporphyrinogen oxidase n=1 Tax=Candidatus Kentrum sp. MB TaxID=2138164 RepID=A0A450XVV3_9GAMM|nr:MAG: oxygen-dependent protoporphyrinogen oxidase [Candidatus Kentron sp. MB]VFK76158.1 MAG: oxygen-dependent protoporphyrinogen oxidase [Candidatus Kentron sp. MB]
MITDNDHPLHVAIIGAGISGLATAFFIRKLSPNSRVALFEKDARCGGTMQSEHRDGFLFEAGPNGFLSNRQETLDLVQESGAERLLLSSNDEARIRYIFTDGLERLPDTPPAFLRTKLLSLRDKLRVLGEVLAPPKKDDSDESLQAFGYRRLGRAFTDIFLDAMSAGIHASTPERLSVNAAFPAIVRLEREYGGLFKGMIKKRRKEAGPGGVLMSFQGGVGAFARHLADTLMNDSPPVAVYASTRVTKLEREGAGYRFTVEGPETESGSRTTRELWAESVILATPAYESAKLLNSLAPNIADRLRAIPYSPIAVVGFGFDNLDHPLGGFGLLTTTKARQKILGILWDSSIFSGRAPADKQLLRVLIGGQRNPELAFYDEPALIALAQEGIEQTMGVKTPPATVFVKRWERGIPNYRLGHPANVRDIHQGIDAYPGLLLNSNAYFGIGINDCVINSLACARRWANGYGGVDSSDGD